MKTLVLPRPKSLKTLNITMQTPFEELLDTPIALPTSEPADPQYTWTIVQGDLPVLSQTPVKITYGAQFYLSGVNTGGSTYNIYFKMFKNAVEVASSYRSTPASYYWTAQAPYYDVQVGDILSIKLWADNISCVRDYQARQIHPTRIFIDKGGTTLKPCNYTVVDGHPILTLGAPSVLITTAFYIYFPDSNVSKDRSAAINISQLGIDSIYGIVRIGYSDIMNPNTFSSISHVSGHPRYNRNYIPTTVVYRSYGELT